MTRRRILNVGLVGLTMTVGTVFTLAYMLRDPINQTACAKLYEGMTEREVIEILGRPCDRATFNTEPLKELNSDGSGREVLRLWARKSWNGPSGSIFVVFEESGIVSSVTFSENENTVLRKFRRWLGLDPPAIQPYLYLTPRSSEPNDGLPD